MIILVILEIFYWRDVAMEVIMILKWAFLMFK